MATSKKNTPKMAIFDDETKGADKDMWFAPIVDGEIKGHGLIPRDFRTYPKEMFDPPSGLTIIPKTEWSDRLKEQTRLKARLSDVRGDIPSLDQNGKGYCWAHSTTSAVMLVRAYNNQPLVRMSAYGIACKIKGFQDEGGWCGLSAKFWREKGCPSAALWPEKSMDRANDNEKTWENAALHKTTEEWVDLTRDVYDVALTFEQLATCLLTCTPCAVDFNWWSHSVCAADLVEVEAGSFGILIWNSWGDSWSTKGMGVLRDSKAIPDSAVAIRVTGATTA
jgi:hypothetical protein